MTHLGVLPTGELVEIHQQCEWDESIRRWVYFDVRPDGSRISTNTFLPFIWGYSTWELAVQAFHAGTISNINHMTRSWK